MSYTAPTNLSTASLGGTGMPAINQATLPAAVRNGSAKDKAAYMEGLQFADVLVNQLTQQLSQNVAATSNLTGDSSDTSGGLFGSGSSSSEYSSLLTQTLSSAVTGSGGLGIAAEIAKSLDPTFGQDTTTKGTKA